MQHRGPTDEDVNNKLLSNFQDDDKDFVNNASTFFDEDTMLNPINLENFFIENKLSIHEEDKDQLEELIMSGMPDNYRR